MAPIEGEIFRKRDEEPHSLERVNPGTSKKIEFTRSSVHLICSQDDSNHLLFSGNVDDLTIDVGNGLEVVQVDRVKIDPYKEIIVCDDEILLRVRATRVLSTSFRNTSADQT